MIADANTQNLGEPVIPTDTLTPDGKDVRGLPENYETATSTPATADNVIDVQSLDIWGYWWVLLIILVGIVAVWWITKRK